MTRTQELRTLNAQDFINTQVFQFYIYIYQLNFFNKYFTIKILPFLYTYVNKVNL